MLLASFGGPEGQALDLREAARIDEELGPLESFRQVFFDSFFNYSGSGKTN